LIIYCSFFVSDLIIVHCLYKYLQNMSAILNAFLVDDEKKSLRNLENLIHQYCPKIHVIGSTQSSLEAVRLIKELSPDVIFLDIEMPEINGFELLKLLVDTSKYKVVFVTAYDQFAIKAIKENALDYLLKPISIKELMEVEKKLLQVFKSHLTKDEVVKDKIVISIHEGYVVEALENILYFQSESNYTTIVRKVGKDLIISKTLKHFENELLNHQFIRIHNSFLIHSIYIEKVVKQESYLVMKGGKKITISRRRMTNLLELLKHNFKSL